MQEWARRSDGCRRIVGDRFEALAHARQRCLLRQRRTKTAGSMIASAVNRAESERLIAFERHSVGAMIVGSGKSESDVRWGVRFNFFWQVRALSSLHFIDVCFHKCEHNSDAAIVLCFDAHTGPDAFCCHASHGHLIDSPVSTSACYGSSMATTEDAHHAMGLGP